uniref:Pro-adrenomedullin n=1 Tax=Gouania willdenowi TaxID=441366 RepID=A0A8C5EMF2_GOUWI
MQLSVRTIICCCVFITVLPPGKGATEKPPSSLDKMFTEYLHVFIKKYLCNSFITDTEETLNSDDGPQLTPSSSASSAPPMRTKRSGPFQSSGCLLITCIYHDLFDRLYQLNTKQKEEKAPPKKLGVHGYGRRRRRSLLDVVHLGLCRERQRSWCSTQ